MIGQKGGKMKMFPICLLGPQLLATALPSYFQWHQLPPGDLSPVPSSLRPSCLGMVASAIINLLGFLPILLGFSTLYNLCK